MLLHYSKNRSSSNFLAMRNRFARNSSSRSNAKHSAMQKSIVVVAHSIGPQRLSFQASMSSARLRKLPCKSPYRSSLHMNCSDAA